MRYIPSPVEPPKASWLAKADKLLTQLRDAPDAKAREKIIDGNKRFWGELKDWLLQRSHGKCWFSEAKDCFAHWDVEHYRPKKSAKDSNGTVHDGYWWLAFDWNNLRVCGNAGNRKKNTFFPLRAGCTRSAPFGDLRYEDPQLLDPIDENDPVLLSFNVEGRAMPAAHVIDQWEKERVVYSVERYNLDFPPLMDKRKTIWAECWERIQEYLRELATYYNDRNNVVAKDRYKEAAKRLRELMRGDRELSSVARACILNSGDPRLAGLLQSV